MWVGKVRLNYDQLSLRLVIRIASIILLHAFRQKSENNFLSNNQWCPICRTESSSPKYFAMKKVRFVQECTLLIMHKPTIYGEAPILATTAAYEYRSHLVRVRTQKKNDAVV